MAETAEHPQELTTTSPGAILKRCREYHDISLDEASETTKIGVSYLKALEDDRITEFANLVYLKGFLRIYAAYLGLSAEDMARMYDKLYGSPPSAADKKNNEPSDGNRTNRRMALIKRMIVPVLLLAALVITAAFFKQSLPPSGNPPLPVATSLPPVPPTQKNTIIQASQSSAQSRPPIPPPDVIKQERKQSLPPVSEQPPSKKNSESSAAFILKIKVTQSGTLTAAVDGSAGQNYDLAVGDVIEWKAEKSVALELSNAGGVEVELNGKPYKSLGPAGKPVYVELDADGVKL